MTSFTLFARGTAITLRQGRMALRLWAVNLLFSLFAVAPLVFVLHGQASHSLMADSLLPRLEVHWLTDLGSRFAQAGPLLVGLVLAAVLFYLLLAVFLSGGIIGSLLRKSRATLAEFFHDCALYFWRFLRLALLSIPFYLLLVGVLHGLFAELLKALTQQAATEWPVIAANLMRLLALALLLGIVSMFFDYVKIGLALGARRSALKETWRTMKFMGRRFFKAWGLYLLAGLAFVALTFLYLEVARRLPHGTWMLVLAVFLWQQLYVLGRQFSRILFYASEIELYKEIAPQKDP